MADDKGQNGFEDEEIQGAPPVVSRAELREQRLSETVTLNRYLYLQTQQFEHMLLDAPDLQALLEVSAGQYAPAFLASGIGACGLYDPEDVLAGLIVGGQRYGRHPAITARRLPHAGTVRPGAGYRGYRCH